MDRTPADTKKTISEARDKVFQAQGEIYVNYRDEGQHATAALGRALQALHEAKCELDLVEQRMSEDASPTPPTEAKDKPKDPWNESWDPALGPPNPPRPKKSREWG